MLALAPPDAARVRRRRVLQIECIRSCEQLMTREPANPRSLQTKQGSDPGWTISSIVVFDSVSSWRFSVWTAFTSPKRKMNLWIKLPKNWNVFFHKPFTSRKILLFPPLPSRLRYLIHRIVENFDSLSSFSIGEGAGRRTAVCLTEMRLHPSLEENYSSINAPGQRAQWKSNDEQREAFRPLRDGASGYQKLPPGNSKPRNKPDKAFYIPRAQCQNSAEKRRDGKFNYRREARSRKANSSRNKEDGEPRKGRFDSSDVPAEGEDGSSGQACPSEDAAPPCALASGNVACTDEGEQCTASNPEPVECEGDAQKDRPSEDSAADQTLDESPDEPKGKQGPNDETKCPSNEARAEDDGPRLDSDRGLVADVKPSPGLAEDVIHDHAVHHELQTSPRTSKTPDAAGTGPRARCDHQCEGSATLNQDPSPPGSAVDLAGLEERRHTRAMENAPADQEEESINSENVTNLNPGDFAAELHSGARVETEETGTQGLDPPNSDGDSADLLKELTACLGETSISIEQPQSDYSTYQSGEVRMGELEFGHVIEIYDFLPQLKTEDIQEAFGSFRDKGFRIKWVDSTHALGLFSSPVSASEALSISHSQLKTRPLSQATKQSKLKVARCSEFLQPVKERAQTNTVIAKRLVIRALGLQTSERKGQRDPKPKNQGETKVQPQKKTDDGTDEALDSAGDPGAE